MVRLWKLLRSRRLAIILLVGLTAYAWLVTLVPLASLDPAAAVAWDARHPLLAPVVGVLGLHRAYSSPIFVAAALLLTLSTAACAWERSRAGVRGWGAQGRVADTAVDRLRLSPSAVVQLRRDSDPDSVFEAVTESFRGLHMRTRREGDLLYASGGRLGLVGSPLFHWALVGLFVFVALGQLTRYQGYVNMVVGESVKDVPTTYSVHLARGALTPASSFTGSSLTLTEFDRTHTEDGVARGAAPRVRLSRGAHSREQWVYPNQPLRDGSLSIQRAITGPALVATVTDARFAARRRIVLYYDAQSKTAKQFTLSDPSAATTLAVEVTPVGGQRVGIVVAGASRGATQTVGVGQVATLADGITMTVDALTYYVQLQVVNDWSVPWVYAMFGLGILGMVLTTFVPPRTVRVLLVDDSAGLRMHIATTQKKNDPAFPRHAERTVRDALSSYSDPDVTAAPEREGTV